MFGVLATDKISHNDDWRPQYRLRSYILLSYLLCMCVRDLNISDGVQIEMIAMHLLLSKILECNNGKFSFSFGNIYNTRINEGRSSDS